VLNDVAMLRCLELIAAAGGGTVYWPPGRFLHAPFNVTTNGTTLLLSPSTTILATQNASLWPVVAPLPGYGCSRDYPSVLNRFSAFITLWNASSVRITTNISGSAGRGVIDGQGASWWAMREDGTLTRDPGAILETMFADHVEIDNVDVLMSPGYHIHPYASSFLHIHDLRVSSGHAGPETDGIDPDSSHDILIERVAIDTGDDAIAVKSGWNEPGLRFNRSSHSILVRDSVLSTGANAFCVGSEMSGGVYNVTAVNVTCADVDVCFRLKSALGRGGFIRDIAMYDSRITLARTAISMSDYYGGAPGPINASLIPRVGYATIRGLVGELVEAAGSFEGLNNSEIDGIVLEDILLHAPKGSWKPCVNVSGSQRNVTPAACSSFVPA
jgi:polygalacturonase